MATAILGTDSGPELLLRLGEIGPGDTQNELYDEYDVSIGPLPALQQLVANTAGLLLFSTMLNEDEVRSLVRQIVEGLWNEIGAASSDASTSPATHAADVLKPGAQSSPGHASVAIGADHGGYRLKQALVAHLRERGYTVHDCGTSSTESVDYPDFAEAVARLVAAGTCDWGIIVDGAGIGSCMAANKVPGIRAASCYDISSARNSREHNHANVLTLGAGLIGENLARQIVDEWLATPFGPGRHKRRVDKIMEIEKRYRQRA